MDDLQIFFDIDVALHEHDDGSARDVNLDGASWSGVDALVVEIVRRYENFIAYGGEGTEVSLPANVLDVVRREGSIHVVFDSPDQTPSRLQLFVCAIETGPPWVELTFLPEAVTTWDATRFVTWVDELMRVGGASAWYFRYENTSWEFRSVAFGSGVVAVRRAAMDQ